MKKGMMLLAVGMSLAGLAAAAPYTSPITSGTSTTGLTLQVKNFCQLANQNPAGTTQTSFDQSYGPVNLGTINAISDSTVTNVLVAAADCNKGTDLNVAFPATAVLTSGANSLTIKNTAVSGPWSSSNPFTMTFADGSYTNTFGNSNYEYHNYTADFHVGGSPNLGNGAWSVPGGNYTGNLVITYSYTE